MRLAEALVELFVYGNTGLLIECWFTGLHSAIRQRDRRMLCTTSLIMILTYGTAGMILGWIHEKLQWPFFLVAVPMTLFIYGWEFGWSHVLDLFKVRAWDYGRTKHTLAGRVQPKYCLWWYLLACAFNPLHDFMTHIFGLVAKYG